MSEAGRLPRRQEQAADGDNASMTQAGRDIYYTTNNYGSDVSQIREIAEEVVRSQAPAIAAEAKALWEDSAREITLSIVEEVIRDSPEALSAFAAPRVQIALAAAQQGYASSPDDDLREVLTSLVVGIAREPARTHRDLLLKQSLDLAPKLSRRQLNTLTILAIFERTRYQNCDGPRDILEKTEELLRPFAGDVVGYESELNHAAGLGCGDQVQLTGEDFGGERSSIFKAFFQTYKADLYEDFPLKDVDSTLDPSEAIAEGLIREVDSPDSALQESVGSTKHYRLNQEMVDELTSLNGKLPQGNYVKRQIVMQMQDSWVSEEAFVSMIREQFPVMYTALQNMDKAEIFKFRISAIGRILAVANFSAHHPEIKNQFEKLLLTPLERGEA